MRQRLPGAARAHNCGRTFPPARQNIRALCPAVCARPTLSAVAIARRLRHFAGERASQFTDSGPLRVELLTVRQAVINIFARRGDLRPLQRALIARDDSKCATAPSRACPAVPPRKALPVREAEAGAAGSDRPVRRRKFMVDAMERRYDISTYHDWSICRFGTWQR